MAPLSSPTGGCLRGSSRTGRAALSVLGLVAAGCSGRTIVAVDPYPCQGDGAIGCAPGLLDDLVGFWRLDDPSGSATARDSTGWGNDGTLVDFDPASAWIADGPEGGALSAQGKGYVNVPRSG